METPSVRVVDGKIVETVEQEVGDEAALQADLDKAQNVLNEATEAVKRAAEASEAAEKAAEDALSVLEDAKAAEVRAEGGVRFQEARAKAISEARSVLNEQSQPSESESDAEDDGTSAEPAENEAVHVPVNGLAAE